MTFFMISGMVAFLALTGLLLCLRGFSRDVKQGKTVGLLVRPVADRPGADRRAVLKHNVRRIIHTSMQTQRDRRHDSLSANQVTLIKYRAYGGR
jgi:hypothetical protein